MEIGAIFLLLVVLVIIVLFIAQPFSGKWRIKPQNSREISALLAERERALNALQELDSDHALNKVPAEEYSAQRASLLQKGSDILRKLDELQGSQIKPLEKPINTAPAPIPAKLLSDEDLEDLVARRRSSNPKKSAGFCSRCGKPILQSDLFCPSCGQVVNLKQPIPNK
jgi:hypothetical protein